MILIPVKQFAGAKHRLGSVLGAEERCTLARVMLEDVLDMLAQWPERPTVAVVTADDRAKQLARHRSCEIIEDIVQAGETEAVALATRVAEAGGERQALVIPADIPLVERNELEAILRAAEPPIGASPAPSGCSVLAPAADGRGTNAVLRCPPSLFPVRFGDDSFAPHLRAARATGLPCTVLRFPGIGLDVDRPGDLASLLAVTTRTRSQELLLAWGVAGRLRARNATALA